ncbi:hypothetical protein OH76DRAFT_1487979 [Lentinus brumalis]|uniref:Uncharacterized protein n=1 Tax=Lentinus brumalis TaxID=2498619 RepID=A0A371CSR2_9APHY|nr:hypothetical protein OH76DRAFT_1487979 [Polyporus brumalis]
MVPSCVTQVSHTHTANEAMTPWDRPVSADYGYSTSTQQWPLYEPYDNYEYNPYQEDGVGVDYQQSASGARHRSGPVPVTNYTALLPLVPEDAPTFALQYPASMGAAVSLCRPPPMEQQISPVIPVQNQQFDLLSACSDGHSAETTFSGNAASPAVDRQKQEQDRLITRRLYSRAVSARVGFTITDPDTITSHGKDRGYLECLEEYIQWLHEQIHVVGQKPPPIERISDDRISDYRLLTGHSLRIILAYQQHTLYELNSQKTQAEVKFMELQNAMLKLRAGKPRVR